MNHFSGITLNEDGNHFFWDRCMASPQKTYDMGLDVVGWVKKGLIDRGIPCPFFLTTNFEIPVAFWRTVLPETFWFRKPGKEVFHVTWAEIRIEQKQHNKQIGDVK